MLLVQCLVLNIGAKTQPDQITKRINKGETKHCTFHILAKGPMEKDKQPN